MEEDKKNQQTVGHRDRRWRRIGLAAAVAGLVVIGGWAAWQKIFKPAEQVVEEVPAVVTDVSQLVNQTEERQGDFVVSDVKIDRKGAKTVVTAKLKYTGEGTTDARVSFILRNVNNGQLQGRKYERIEGLAAGEEREVEIAIVGDFERSNVYEVGVERI
jgi:hypothetical protein